jgi:hypothetical protein
MRQLHFVPETKEEGLREFQRNGWTLVDATYEPVNMLGPQLRDGVIIRDYALLRDDLLTLTPDRADSLILIKANVCRILQSKLTGDGFKVLNRGDVICFPSTRRQTILNYSFPRLLTVSSAHSPFMP